MMSGGTYIYWLPELDLGLFWAEADGESPTVVLTTPGGAPPPGGILGSPICTGYGHPGNAEAETYHHRIYGGLPVAASEAEAVRSAIAVLTTPAQGGNPRRQAALLVQPFLDSPRFDRRL